MQLINRPTNPNVSQVNGVKERHRVIDRKRQREGMEFLSFLGLIGPPGFSIFGVVHIRQEKKKRISVSQALKENKLLFIERGCVLACTITCFKFG